MSQLHNGRYLYHLKKSIFKIAYRHDQSSIWTHLLKCLFSFSIFYWFILALSRVHIPIMQQAIYGICQFPPSHDCYESGKVKASSETR